MVVDLSKIKKKDTGTSLYKETPIGLIRVLEWEEKELIPLADEQLLQKAIEENKNFCISPATFAMIEKRFLTIRLQQMINTSIGVRF